MITTIIGALLIGMTLGLLGAGGSTITVPILVYLVGHDTKISIAESMAIVGLISAVGAIPLARAKQVDWTSVILFGIPAMFGTFLGAFLGGLAADALQLLVFGVVLILAAGIMMRKAFMKVASVDSVETSRQQRAAGLKRYLIVFMEGVLVGMLTGFVGVGGGFLIVPALLILGKLPMRMAIGTSLFIIVMNSSIGFATYQYSLVGQGLSVDWYTIAMFSLIGLVGCTFGQLLNKRLNQRALLQVFAVFLILIGGYVIINEGRKIFRKPNSATGSSVSTVQVIRGEFVSKEVNSAQTI